MALPFHRGLPPAKQLKGGGGEIPPLSPENMVDWYVFHLSSNAFPFLIIRKPNTARSHSPLLQLLRRPQTNPSHGTTPPHRESTECHCNRSDASPGRGQSPRRPSSRSSSTSIDDTLIEASPVARDRQPLPPGQVQIFDRSTCEYFKLSPQPSEKLSLIESASGKTSEAMRL